MKRFIRQSENKAGFTIVELLTVMSIIVILIGILVPSLNMVRRYATDVKQKAQFHSTSEAMELFKNEFEVYPDSATSGVAPDYDGATQPQHYPGAARLCEAMVGQDLLGFNPASHFRADCTADGTNKIYDNPKDSLPTATRTDNLQSRKGPYLQLERANAYRLSDIYADTGDLTYNNLFVLCDEYTRVKNISTGKKIGMPVLYYKANTTGIMHDPNSDYLPAGTDNKGQIYNYLDNDYLVELGMPWNPSAVHPLHEHPEKFYENTKNDKIEITEGRPYRSDSYILLSAGFDGQYGTPDDIFNFEKE